MTRTLALAAVLGSASAHAAPCNEAKLAELDQRLATPDELSLSTAARGLYEACTLPPALATPFKKLLMVAEDGFAVNAGLSVVEADLAL